MKSCYVGFDTSNYTTSVAVCDEAGSIVASLKTPLRVRSGERGLRQSDAVFEHVRNLPPLIGELREALDGYTPVAVGVSATPRDADGSYMPCFLAGRCAAYSFGAGAAASVYELSHQSGHIAAALYSAGKTELIGSEFYAFHVSGGTTELLLVSGGRELFSVKRVGEASDINAGQAIDRVGVMMGLDFPCGAELEALAAEYGEKPYRHGVCVRDGRCSLSGVENIAKGLYDRGGDKRAVAAFVFDFIERTLERMCEDAMKKYGERPVVFAGGVMSNMLMRERLSRRFEAYFSEPRFSADNAAGIALLCRLKALSAGVSDKPEVARYD